MESTAFLTPAEAARELRLSTVSVLRHLKAGTLHGVQIGTGPKPTWRIPAAELERMAGK